MAAKQPHPDTEFVTEMVERFQPFAPVTSKRMFGGFGLFVDGGMFGLVADGALYLKADDENRGAFEAAGMHPWSYEAKGRPVTMRYYPIPDEDLDDVEALGRWFTGSRAAARRAAARSRRKR